MYFGFTDATRRAQWLNPKTIFQGVEAAKLLNAAFSPAAVYVLRRENKNGDVSAYLCLMMRSGHILLAMLAFINLAMSCMVC